MGDRLENTAFNVVKSLTGWWELAGLDAAVSDTSVNWLAGEASADAVIMPVKTAASPKITPPPAAPSVTWPGDISTLRAMVTDGAPLPGNSYSPMRFASVGPEICDVMIISDLPDIIETSDGIRSANADLLTRMMAAIGIETINCYCTWLATSMPSTEEVPEHDFAELAPFILHQIKLIRPKSLVILGSSACKALLNEELMNTRAAIQNVNHDGLNISALTTFHPRTLIARPTMKAQAWRDLQMFANRADE